MTESKSNDGFDSLREKPVRTVSERDGAVVVEVAGELDLYNAPELRRALLESVERDASSVVVDLAAVEFIDSTALGVLVEARAKLADRARLVLAAPAPAARRALEVSGLDRHFSVRDSVEQALAED